MSSEVEICNLALAHLGDDATVASIDPPEGSAQAEHCARFYPIARDAMLEMHPWGFATRRITLAALDVDASPWAYAYSYPSECLKILAVYPYGSTSDDDVQPYETESISTGARVIMTDSESATCRYTVRVTDTQKFPPMFVDALTRLLASYLAGPVVKGEAGRKTAMEQFNAFNISFARASVSDANQRNNNPEHLAGWLGAR